MRAKPGGTSANARGRGCLCELQTIGGGARVDSATENVPRQRVPDSGTPGDGGERESPLGGRYEELCLVVGRDQNTCKSPL